MTFLSFGIKNHAFPSPQIKGATQVSVNPHKMWSRNPPLDHMLHRTPMWLLSLPVGLTTERTRCQGWQWPCLCGQSRLRGLAQPLCTVWPLIYHHRLLPRERVHVRKSRTSSSTHMRQMRGTPGQTQYPIPFFNNVSGQQIN